MRLQDLHPGHTWVADRVLGQGGFGQVAVFSCQKTEEGAIIDQLAIKQQLWRVGFDVSRRTGVCKEAVMTRDMQTLDEGGRISHLRRYKFNAATRKQRLFMLYAPYSDLERLTTRYKLFDEYLPELFIWHCAVQIFEAMQVLDLSPPSDTLGFGARGRGLDEFYTIHFDLKPNNCFLDYEHEPKSNTKMPSYPNIRVGDFGLSAYMHPSDPNNPAAYRNQGTEGHKPPEQMYWGETSTNNPGTAWQVPPNNTAGLYPRGSRVQPYERKHNIWTASKVLFDIMTGSTWVGIDKVYCHRRNDGYLVSQLSFKDYRDLGYHFLGKDSWNDFYERSKVWLGNVDQAKDAFNDHYSNELRTFVRRGLRPRVSKRPIALQMYNAAVKGRKQYLGTLKEKLLPDPNADPSQPPRPNATGGGKSAMPVEEEHPNGVVKTWENTTKLYYKENEINAMPKGGADFPDNMFYVDDMVKNIAWCPADWPRLDPPVKRWGDYPPGTEFAPQVVMDKAILRLARDELHKDELQKQVAAKRVREERDKYENDAKRRKTGRGGKGRAGEADIRGMHVRELLNRIKVLRELDEEDVDQLFQDHPSKAALITELIKTEDEIRADEKRDKEDERRRKEQGGPQPTGDDDHRGDGDDHDSDDDDPDPFDAPVDFDWDWTTKEFETEEDDDIDDDEMPQGPDNGGAEDTAPHEEVNSDEEEAEETYDGKDWTVAKMKNELIEVRKLRAPKRTGGTKGAPLKKHWKQALLDDDARRRQLRGGRPRRRVSGGEDDE